MDASWAHFMYLLFFYDKQTQPFYFQSRYSFKTKMQPFIGYKKPCRGKKKKKSLLFEMR